MKKGLPQSLSFSLSTRRTFLVRPTSTKKLWTFSPNPYPPTPNPHLLSHLIPICKLPTVISPLSLSLSIFF